MWPPAAASVASNNLDARSLVRVRWRNHAPIPTRTCAKHLLRGGVLGLGFGEECSGGQPGGGSRSLDICDVSGGEDEGERKNDTYLGFSTRVANQIRWR